MANNIILFIFLILSLNVLAQNQINNNNNSGMGLEAGYSFRKVNELNAGVNYLFYSKTDYKKASVYGASLQVYTAFGDLQVFGSRLSIEYIFWTKKGLGFQFNLSGDLNKYIKYGLDTRVGINYGGVYYIFYGYNLYQNIPNDFLSKHSIGLIFRLNWAIFDLENP